MGKYVVYVRARDERELEDAGLDVGEWVRELVKVGIDTQIGTLRAGPAPELGQRSRTSKVPKDDGFKSDFRPRDIG